MRMITRGGTVRQHGLIFRVRWANGEENVLRTFSVGEGVRVLPPIPAVGLVFSSAHKFKGCYCLNLDNSVPTLKYSATTLKYIR